MNNSNTIHTLWIGQYLSAMELLTLYSFRENGHSVQVWTYSPSLNIPDGVTQRDANEIIPEADVFHYQHANKYGHGKGSYAGFSDIFRYKLLYEHGGIWADMDITCLQPLDLKTPYFFRHHHTMGLVGNLMKCPKHSPLMKWCYEEAAGQVKSDNMEWLLPIEILKQGVRNHQLEAYIGDISNPDNFPLVKEYYLHDKPLPSKWFIFHWMNEEFRRLQLDKDMAIKNSVYEQLLNKYGITHRVATREETRKVWWATSKLHYAWLNLKARWNWYVQLSK